MISPPKTGSSWLAANLRRHPQLFIPEIKEVKYFNSLYRWLDLEWYCSHFSLAGERLAGECSPSYAALPLAMIRQLRHWNPDLKLIFLMRDPVSRAWSHAKHNHKYQEVNFGSQEFGSQEAGSRPLAVSQTDWLCNLTHPWSLVSGDYLGQLQRFSQVFPRSQIHVGFYEAVVREPGSLLRSVFRFLGVNDEIDLTAFPTQELIQAGSTFALPPALAATLRHLLRGRTQELVAYLEREFRLEVPPEWQMTLGQHADQDALPCRTVDWEISDEQLSSILQMEDRFHSAFRFIECYRGFNIVWHRGQLYAFLESLGRNVIFQVSDAQLGIMLENKSCFLGETLDLLRERITSHLLEQAQSRIMAMETQARLAEETAAKIRQQLQNELNEGRNAINHVAADLAAVVAFLNRPTRLRRLIRAIKQLPVRMMMPLKIRVR